MFEGTAGGEPVEPARIQLYWTWLGTDGRTVVPWPLDVAPDDFTVSSNADYRCLVLAGAAASKAADVLENTSRLVRFENEEGRRWLLARTLLPGEDGCGPEYSD